MSASAVTPAQIDQLSGMVAEYIAAQREAVRPRAIALSEAQRQAMAPFFPVPTLDRIRLTVLTDKRIEDPPFYPTVRAMGISNLPPFSQMAAVTFDDTVVSNQPFTSRLLFHELVHVVQYQQLGVQRFAALYVAGFLSGGSYDEIPIEKNAYALEHRYVANSNGAFSVEAEVGRAISEGRL